MRSRYGIKCRSNFDDATFRFYFLANNGFFYSNFLESYASSYTFIDVGANKGVYSIIAAKNNSCKKVISFEPIPETFELLKQNCSLNNVAHKCRLHNLAISNACGVKKNPFDKYTSGKTSLVLKAETEQSNLTDEQISIHTVDKSIFSNILVEDDMNYILKVDVMGTEDIVLKEIFKCKFSKAITNIFYQVDERWVEPTSIEKLLSENGFKNFKKHGTDEIHYNIMASK